MFLISFDCTGHMSFDSQDEFEALNYLRDTYPDFGNFEITEVKPI